MNDFFIKAFIIYERSDNFCELMMRAPSSFQFQERSYIGKDLVLDLAWNR